MLFRKLAIIATMAALAGCSSTPEPLPITKSEPIGSQPPVATLIIPAQESSGAIAPSSVQDLMRGIEFHSYTLSPGNDFSKINSFQWKFSESKFNVEKYAASRYGTSEFYKVSISYDGTVAMSKAGDNYQLAFSVNRKNYYTEPKGADGKALYQVDFPGSDIAYMMSGSSMSWNFEVNSDFNTDSTYSNFARLTRREVFGGSGRKDPVTGKIFKERFWINVAGKEIPIHMEAYPYRNGSKILIHAILHAKLMGSNVDFVSTAEALKKEINRIVKS